MKVNKITDVKEQFEKIALDIVNNPKRGLVKKNHDYGDNNLLRHGIKGILVRIDDKTARIDNLQKIQLQVKDESIIDTFADIAGYCINAIRLYEEGKL